MCIQFHAPKKSMIKPAWVSNSFNSQRDGAGLCWWEDDQLHFKKGLMTLQDTLDALNQVPADSDVCMHFRFGTSGGVTKAMTHPFTPSDTLEGVGEPVLMQNGTIGVQIIVDALNACPLPIEEKRAVLNAFKDNKVSDTWAIAQAIFAMDKDQAQDYLEKLTKRNWSRWILWYPDEPKPRHIAKDNIEEKGCTFSNSGAFYGSFDYGSYMSKFDKGWAAYKK